MRGAAAWQGPVCDESGKERDLPKSRDKKDTALWQVPLHAPPRPCEAYRAAC